MTSTAWFTATKDYVSAACDCPEHGGREIRLFAGMKSLPALQADAAALHRAALIGSRMPFSHAANTGVVLADRIPA